MAESERKRSMVTTRRGDKGTTVSLAGDDLPKHHAVMEAVGAVDEARAHLAMLRLRLSEADAPDGDAIRACVTRVMHGLFAIGAACSDPEDRKPDYHPVRIGPQHITWLEDEQTRLEAQVELARSFVVGASNEAAAQADIACTVVRRLERRLSALMHAYPAMDAQHVLVFVNRLSDYLFIAARYLEGGKHEPVDYSQLD